MDSSTLPILIALAVAMLGFGIGQILRNLLSDEKRKLQGRLSTEGRGGLNATLVRSITVQTDATGLSAILVRSAVMGRLQRKLLQAYPGTSVAKFMMWVIALSAISFLIASAIAASALIGVAAAALGAYIPFLVLNNRRNRRQKLLATQLPEALDFLSRILRAGHSMSTGLQMMGQELPNPMAEEFRRTYDQHSLGVSMEEALKDMAVRIESTDFAFFVTAVLIQRQTGGDLSEVLNNISGMIRQRIRLAQAG